MEPNISRALRIDKSAATRQRDAQAAAQERVAQYYDARYGSEFGALVRNTNDFDF
ncbi:hypothetical protein ACF044_16600 [Microbacterium sp. NPDC016588]|uniref:hypothetical protein n=1 Tax=unclassified Microbacterium TaxID=2609290 RepID=UPI000A531F26|nr:MULTISPECIES: hypothetical protein [unclassified Microbacterium]